jgi:hypothetical protein
MDGMSLFHAASAAGLASAQNLSTVQLMTCALLLIFHDSVPWAQSKKLWEVDEEDLEELKEATDEKGKGEEEKVLGSMLDVMEKFQAFRDSFDGFLEEVDGAGLVLDW